MYTFLIKFPINQQTIIITSLICTLSIVYLYFLKTLKKDRLIEIIWLKYLHHLMVDLDFLLNLYPFSENYFSFAFLSKLSYWTTYSF